MYKYSLYLLPKLKTIGVANEAAKRIVEELINQI